MHHSCCTYHIDFSHFEMSKLTEISVCQENTPPAAWLGFTRQVRSSDSYSHILILTSACCSINRDLWPPKITLKELQISTAETGVSVHRTTLSHTLHRWGFMEECLEKGFRKKKKKNTCLDFAKLHMADFPYTWKKVWSDETKAQTETPCVVQTHSDVW